MTTTSPTTTTSSSSSTVLATTAITMIIGCDGGEPGVGVDCGCGRVLDEMGMVSVGGVSLVEVGMVSVGGVVLVEVREMERTEEPLG